MKKTLLLFSTLLFCWFVSANQTPVFSQDMGANYWFNKGVDEQNLNKKVEHYLKAIQEKPNFIEAFYNLALVYINLKEYQKAEDAFKKAIMVNPSELKTSLKGTILKRLGSLYRNMGRYEESEQSFQAALNITQEKKLQALILYELGQTKIAQNQFDQAIAFFEQGKRESPEDRATFETGIQIAQNHKAIYELYQQGLDASAKNDLVHAAERFSRVIELNPNHQAAKSQLDKINQAIEQNRLSDKAEIQILFDQAKAYMNTGDLKSAIQYFENIKKRQADYPEVDRLIVEAKEKQYAQLLSDQQLENLYIKGTEQYKNGNYTIALTTFEQVNAQSANYKDVAAQISRLRNEINKLKTSSNELVDDSFAHYSTGEGSNATKQQIRPSPEIDQFFKKRSQRMNAAIDSQLVQNFYQEALELMQKRDWLQATIVMEKIRLIIPDYKDTEFLLNQAKSHLNMGGQVTENDGSAPSNTQMSTMMFLAFLAGILILPAAGILFFSPVTRARYFLLQKRYDKAREIYENLLSKKPNNVKLYITLANIYINENRIDSVAVSVFEKAILYNDDLKFRLEPIVTKYYLEKSKHTQNPKSLLSGSLKDELDRMGH
ncbi:MAG: tetratricopeptide repeat protein [Candidatus Zhuqueibacterota bacterium]